MSETRRSEEFALSRPEALELLGWSGKELDHRTITINRVPPEEIARIRRCDLIPAFRPRLHHRLWEPMSACWIGSGEAADKWAIQREELSWRGVCANGLLLRDVVKLCAAGLAPYWIKDTGVRTKGPPAKWYLPPFQPGRAFKAEAERESAKLYVTLHWALWVATYRGYHAYYSEVDVPKAYNPADSISHLNPVTA